MKHNFYSELLKGIYELVCVITQAVNCCLLTAESWFQSQDGFCGTCVTWVGCVNIKI
jgi:hypothetical protein